MRISDWSSDVCSSDLLEYRRAGWLGWCPRCELEHYPRTDPAVIVAITDGSRLLLGRNPGWPPHRYSTLAGFVEPGESLEQTVEREVLGVRSEAHTSEIQSLMRISYAVLCLIKKNECLSSPSLQLTILLK